MISFKKYADLIGYEGDLDLDKLKSWAWETQQWKIQDEEDEEYMTVEEWCKVNINGNIRYLGV